MSTAPDTEQEIAQLVVEIGQNLDNTFVNMSAICFLVYDVLINLDREVEHIWKARWSVLKVLFVFGRYYGLCYIIANFIVTTTVGLSLEVCKRWWWYMIMAGDIFFTTMVNLILIMRLHAMWRSRKVLIFFISLFICELGFELYTMLKMAIEVTGTTFTIPAGIPLPGCFASSSSKIVLLSWIPCMLIATAFLAMTIANVVRAGYSTPKRLIDIKHIPPIIVLMVRDGVLYYCLMFSILLVTILLVETAEGLLTGISLPWLIVVHSLSASRLVLNLREEGGRTEIGMHSTGLQTITAPVFVMGPIGRAGLSAEVYYEA